MISECAGWIRPSSKYRPRDLFVMLDEIADKVRQASREGRILSLSEVWSGTDEEFAAFGDIVLIREGPVCYLYSSDYMSRRYAETAVGVASGDACRMIAETVRSESATYPRPTPVDAFARNPYNLSMDQVTAALQVMSGDDAYADIRPVSASDGTLFLFSSSHMNPGLAASLAERIAVGQYENP
jgi:hypothetical protein